MNTTIRICALIIHSFIAIPIAAMEQSKPSGENPIIHGWAACQGWREYMEDRAAVRKYSDGSVVALVCDGHGGKDVADYAIGRIPELLQAKLNSTPDKNEECIKQLLISSFEECDKEIEQKSQWARQGSTAALAYVREGKLYTVHTGDSRVFLVKQADGSVIETTDHKPMASRELTRIGKTTAFVTDKRLYGILAVSRALGDFYLKNRDKSALIATPEVFSETFGPGDTVVIVSDGVTDALKPCPAAHCVRQWTREESWAQEDDEQKRVILSYGGRDHAKNTVIDAHSERAAQLAIYLVNKALFKNSSDNLTALVLHQTGGKPCPVHHDSDAETTEEEFHPDEYWDEDDSSTWY